MKTTVKTAVLALLVFMLAIFLFWRIECGSSGAKQGYETTIKPEELPSEHSTTTPELSEITPPGKKHPLAPVIEVPSVSEATGPWIKILNYHEIFPKSVKESKDPKINRFSKPSDLMLIVTAEDFEKQMEYLSKNFKCVNITDFGEHLEAKKPYTENVVLVTFDGADQTIYDQAYPILKKYNIPATLFLHINSLKMDKTAMKWETIKKLNEEGLIDIESHSLSHPHLSRKSKGESEEAYEVRVRKELAESKLQIEKKLGKKVEYFAYPYGSYNSTVMRLLKETGYKAAVTVQWDKNNIETNPYALKRRGVFGTMSLKQFKELFTRKFKDDMRKYAD